ncbi:MAG: class I SAM-dependent methyltransferase [Bacteroidetes bacterium]|nr:class I SAM-dependent methyltransferase [Bacteroidota bacterium]MBP8073321.1 class I SAM-dependent methyltransferase [Bacteroidia bacterium]
MQGQWFESWFDSPWYPILYSHRDYAEAEGFISHLLQALAPPPESRFLDLACGRGRHSIFIHQHGYDVTGLDLSAASIADANLSATEGLRFAVHDMRQPLDGDYDFILNLFTSFGYFETLEEHVEVLINVKRSLVPDGTFVLDFFNIVKVLADLVPAQEIDREGIHFSIRRSFEDGMLIKTIDLVDDGKEYHFKECVKGFDLGLFESLFAAAELEITTIWGDYAGGKFEENTSPRLILFAKHANPSAVEPS